MNGIKVESRGAGYIDFTVANDCNLYRYEESTGKMKKIFGFPSEWSKALRGKERKRVEKYAAIAYERNLPFVIFG